MNCNDREIKESFSSEMRIFFFFCSVMGGIFRGHLQIQENAFLILKLVAKKKLFYHLS